MRGGEIIMADQTQVGQTTTTSSSDVTVEDKGRGADDRIQELVARNKELAQKNEQIVGKLETIEKKISSIPVPTPPIVKEDPNPQLDQAVDVIKKRGKLADTQYVDEKLKAIEDRMILDSEHRRNEQAYDGTDGRPKYDRYQVEEYMRKNGIYNAQAAYDEMHKAEILDWEIKKYEKERTKKPFVAKTSSTSGNVDDQTITREKVNEWLSTPEGRVKYEQHRKEVLQLMAEGKL